MCVQQEKAKLATVTADHMKQHELHKNKIHELKEKLSKSEVCTLVLNMYAYVNTDIYLCYLHSYIHAYIL